MPSIRLLALGSMGTVPFSSGKRQLIVVPLPDPLALGRLLDDRAMAHIHLVPLW
jgi:hypothetical protein